MLAMPASVLTEICRAIEQDEQAKEYARQVMIPIIPPFSRNLSKVIMRISNVEVRRWALNEIKGVEHDYDNTA